MRERYLLSAMPGNDSPGPTAVGWMAGNGQYAAAADQQARRHALAYITCGSAGSARIGIGVCGDRGAAQGRAEAGCALSAGIGGRVFSASAAKRDGEGRGMEAVCEWERGVWEAADGQFWSMRKRECAYDDMFPRQVWQQCRNQSRAGQDGEWAQYYLFSMKGLEYSAAKDRDDE